MYLGWEAKVEQIFYVYEVQEDQKVKLASLKFLDYTMQWWYQTVMDIGLNKRPFVVSIRMYGFKLEGVNGLKMFFENF